MASSDDSSPTKFSVLAKMRILDTFPVAPYPVDPALAGFTDSRRALICPRSLSMPDPNERMSLNVREYMMNIEYRRLAVLCC